MYATCTDGVLNDNNACPSNTFWDDVEGDCVESSVTCQGKYGAELFFYKIIHPVLSKPRAQIGCKATATLARQLISGMILQGDV